MPPPQQKSKKAAHKSRINFLETHTVKVQIVK
jgi:hypothetical protein